MMTQEEIFKLYNKNREKLHTTKDQSHMIGAENYMNKLTHYVIGVKPEIVEEGIEIWEASHVNNYLTEKEAMDAASKLINTTGEKAPKWSSNVLFDAVRSLGAPLENEGVFNKWALFYTMNWLYSDYAKTSMKYIDSANIPLYFYECAVEKLTDPDCTRWIRSYLKLE